MTDFVYKEDFPVSEVDKYDQRFMSRIDQERMSANVDRLVDNIKLRGQLDPVGIGRLKGDTRYLLIYGFTRFAAILKIGWSTIKANVYDDLSESEARMLNAENNTMRLDLNAWERAIQIKTLKDQGTAIDADDPEKQTICKIMNMSRANVYNWLKVVSYNSSKLHNAIASDRVKLTYALVFARYPVEVTDAVIDECIADDWSISTLELKLLAAVHSPILDAGDAIASDGKSRSPILDAGDELASLSSNQCPILDACDAMASNNETNRPILDDSSIANIQRAGAILMRVTKERLAGLSDGDIVKLHDALKSILEVIYR